MPALFFVSSCAPPGMAGKPLIQPWQGKQNFAVLEESWPALDYNFECEYRVVCSSLRNRRCWDAAPFWLPYRPCLVLFYTASFLFSTLNGWGKTKRKYEVDY
jgi:hypothetical protein